MPARGQPDARGKSVGRIITVIGMRPNTLHESEVIHGRSDPALSSLGLAGVGGARPQAVALAGVDKGGGRGGVEERHRPEQQRGQVGAGGAAGLALREEKERRGEGRGGEVSGEAR